MEDYKMVQRWISINTLPTAIDPNRLNSQEKLKGLIGSSSCKTKSNSLPNVLHANCCPQVKERNNTLLNNEPDIND